MWWRKQELTLRFEGVQILAKCLAGALLLEKAEVAMLLDLSFLLFLLPHSYNYLHWGNTHTFTCIRGRATHATWPKMCTSVWFYLHLLHTHSHRLAQTCQTNQQHNHLQEMHSFIFYLYHCHHTNINWKYTTICLNTLKHKTQNTKTHTHQSYLHFESVDRELIQGHCQREDDLIA